jgi:hypothetical protein
VTPDFTDPRLNERWDDRVTDSLPLVLALRGWFPPEYSADGHWRWATRTAATGLWCGDAPRRGVLRFRLLGPARNSVALRLNGRDLQTLPTGPETHEIPVELTAGLNTLEWTLHGTTFRPRGADPRELGFMVENLSVSVP